MNHTTQHPKHTPETTTHTNKRRPPQYQHSTSTAHQEDQAPPLNRTTPSNPTTPEKKEEPHEHHRHPHAPVGVTPPGADPKQPLTTHHLKVTPPSQETNTTKQKNTPQPVHPNPTHNPPRPHPPTDTRRLHQPRSPLAYYPHPHRHLLLNLCSLRSHPYQPPPQTTPPDTHTPRQPPTMPTPYTHMPTEGRYPSLTLRPAPLTPPTPSHPPTSTHPTPSSLPKGSVHCVHSAPVYSPTSPTPTGYHTTHLVSP